MTDRVYTRVVDADPDFDSGEVERAEQWLPHWTGYCGGCFMCQNRARKMAAARAKRAKRAQGGRKKRSYAEMAA